MAQLKSFASVNFQKSSLGINFTAKDKSNRNIKIICTAFVEKWPKIDQGSKLTKNFRPKNRGAFEDRIFSIYKCPPPEKIKMGKSFWYFVVWKICKLLQLPVTYYLTYFSCISGLCKLLFAQNCKRFQFDNFLSNLQKDLVFEVPNANHFVRSQPAEIVFSS